MIRIKIPFRLHITLIAMHDCSFRKNGGIGLSVNSGCTLTARKSLTTNIRNNDFVNDPRKLLDIKALVDKIAIEKGLPHKPEIIINGDVYFHSGLGAGTAITLACIEALFLINNVNYEIREIKALSGRGGTSGIGVNSYFSGGFIFDIGHVADDTKHKPSRFATSHTLPISLSHVPFNFDKLFFILPLDPAPIHGDSERDFFTCNTPIDEKSVHETCYLSIFGALASVIDGSLSKFSNAIHAIQKTKWKSLEIERAGIIVKSLITDLTELKCLSVGMSSLGHGVYFILENSYDLHKVENLAKTKNCKLIPLSPSNNGREIEIV